MNRFKSFAAMTLLALLAWTTPALAQARADRWKVVYLSLSFGAQPGRMETNESTEFIYQVTNENVPSRGTIVVPGTSVVVPGATFEQTGFLFSLHGGFNHEMGRWIIGLEGGVDMTRGSSDVTNDFFSLPATLLTPITTVTATRQATSGGAWSVTGRAGQLVWSDLYLYGLFGVTGAGRKVVAVDTWSNVPGGPSAPGPGGATVNLGPLGPYVTTVEESRHAGVLVGLGGEKAINDVWSLGFEYQYAKFPQTTFHFTDPSIDVQGPVSQFQPIQGASAAAVPGDTLVTSSDHRIVARVIYRLPISLPFLR